MWILSTGAQKALLSKVPAVAATKIGTTISFGDGDGTGGTDTINDSGSGLGVFGKHDFILVVGGTFNGVMVKALTVAAGKIEVVAGTFTTVASGTNVALVKITSGSLAQVFQNMSIDGYTGVRPANADLTESGTKIIQFSLDGGAFTAGLSENGMNFGEFTETTLGKAIDPGTGVAEIWRGSGLVTATLGWVRCYANDKTTGASTSAVRMDGVAAVSGGDFNLNTGLSIVSGVNSEVSTVEFTVEGA